FHQQPEDNIDKYVNFDNTPDGEDDDSAGIDPGIEEDEEGPLVDNRRSISLARLLDR
ncbi:hypothetical protein DFQ27_000208, partial [Actinomortierella ambigua]